MPKNIFYIDGAGQSSASGGNEVHAGGCLFYKRSAQCIQVLIQEIDNKYEDIGGRIDKTDADIYDTICREVEEETNGLITKDAIKDRLKKAPSVYIPNAKYIIFIVEALKEEAKYTAESFGPKEIYSNVNRVMGWIHLVELLSPSTVRYKLNWRMRNKALFFKLHDINNAQRNKIKMFHAPTKQNEVKKVETRVKSNSEASVETTSV